MSAQLSDDLVRIFRDGSPEERRAFVEGCPPSPLRDLALGLVSSDDPTQQVMALSSLVQAYGHGQSAVLASEIARAGHVLGRAVLETQEDGGALLPFTVSGMAATGLAALNLAGRYSEALTFADTLIPFYESLVESVNLPTIYAAKIDALLQLEQIDAARALMQDVEERGLAAPDLARLKGRIAELTTPVTELRGLRDEPDADSHPGLRETADAITSVLNRSGSEMNEWVAKKVIRDATSIFVDAQAGRDPARLESSLDRLTEVRAWTREHGNETDDNDALWGMYLCRKRLGRFSAAADALEDLRQNTEAQRAGISNPLERGGVTSNWPYLFEGLCDTLATAGRTEELLDAIEGAKGRAIADRLTQREGDAVADSTLHTSTQRFLSLIRAEGVHYLTFFVDEEWTLAVLAAKDGFLYQSEHLPVGKEQIRQAASYADPRLWGQADPRDPLRKRAPDVSSVLAPLVAWLTPYCESGLIAEGDHLVYSPDEHLHHVPLHYLLLNGEPLVQRVSVSRTHGAHALCRTLGASASRPADSLSVEAPTVEDSEKPGVLEALHRAPAWLAEHLPGDELHGEQATLSALALAKLHDRVLHFATHGVFPHEGASELAESPFESSGLVLASDRGLPTADDLSVAISEDALLSPARVLQLDLDFSGSHATLQACVTGLAKEGVGGDALGLDWALTQAGAASLLASHWDVSASLSAEFSERFYQRWLEGGQTRAAAWRGTALELMGAAAPSSEPYSWAAFSLSGDFR